MSRAATRPAPRPRRRLLLVLAGVAAAGVAAACTEVPTGAETPFSIAFEHLPFPAVVLGDVLRDSTGAVAPLAATAFNAAGDPIPDAPIEYVIVGGAATLLPGDQVRGDSLGGEVRISAFANGIPSLPRTLRVVRRPDSLAGPDTALSAVTWSLPPNPTLDRSAPLELRVLSLRPDSAPAPVQSWVLRFQLSVGGAAVAPEDTTLAWLVDDNGRRSVLDTTDTDGRASRRVRVNGANRAIDGLDSVVVSVTAQGVATPLRGAPVRLALPVRPRQ